MKLEEYNGVIGKIIENGEKLQCIEKDIQAIKSRIQRMESCVNLYSDYSSKIMDPAILVLINSGLCAKNMRHAQSELHLKELHNTKDALLAENEVLFEKALGMIRDEQSSKVQTITKSEVVSKIEDRKSVV